MLFFHYNNYFRCIPQCSLKYTKVPTFTNASFNECELCHEGCKSGCQGPSDTECFSCKFTLIQNGISKCVTKCPINMYPDNNKKCQPCYKHCSGNL